MNQNFVRSQFRCPDDMSLTAGSLWSRAPPRAPQVSHWARGASLALVRELGSSAAFAELPCLVSAGEFQMMMVYKVHKEKQVEN